MWDKMGIVGCLGALVLVGGAAFAQEIALPPLDEVNAEEGWRLSDGEGETFVEDGEPVLSVRGEGDNFNFWRTPDLNLEPGALYQLEFLVRGEDVTTGSAVTGPAFSNRDIATPGEEWRRVTSYFMAPDPLASGEAWLRFGQWHSDGTVAFKDITLRRAEAVYHREGDIPLGEGEALRDSVYHFEAPMSHKLTNHSRPLDTAACSFNTSRWAFSTEGDSVGYRHAIPGHAFGDGAVTLTVNYRQGGRVRAEARKGDGAWQTIGRVDGLGTERFALPADLFPADELQIQLVGEEDEDGGAIQVHGYRFEGTLTGEPPDAEGSTDYVATERADGPLQAAVVSLGDGVPGGDNHIVLDVEAPLDEETSMTANISVEARGGDEARHQSVEKTIAPGAQRITLPYEVPGAGEFELRWSLDDGGYEASHILHVAELYETGYGARLPGGEDLGLWWASTGWKISRERPAPEAEDEVMTLRAARNEAEAAQFVLRPEQELRNVTVTPGALDGPGDARLGADVIDVLEVGYVPVQQPTDERGLAAPWPDPLPKLTGPIDIAADRNQPFWVRVSVPEDAVAGIYRGEVTIEMDDATAAVPLEVEVYDFTLPQTSTCETAFGFNSNRVFEYHGLEAEEDRRAVLEEYLESFSGHRVSPYEPAPLDPFEVTWPDAGEVTELVEEVGVDEAAEALDISIDWSDWEAAMEHALENHGFNTFRLPSTGMGGGTFHAQYAPELLGFGADDPEYQALFTAYWQKVEAKLREKGWLDKAYLYWFDEPSSDDYEFVMEGWDRIREAAPDIQRMLTEHVTEELFGGPEIWCPVSPQFDMDDAEARREHGERFWWYVCTVPKAPYATLFIDHPGTSLRAWLWQTWQREIDGVLVWETTYWTSDAAYPDSLQNPYEDPMGWQSSYGTEPGTRQPWGNGDGRFLYPPRAAADGDPEEPVLEGPVDSIRWEMLRDGIEDYDYLAILERLLEEHGAMLDEGERDHYEALLEVPADITASMTDFTVDPAPIEARRHEIARAIEALKAMNE
ncbi:MAG: glycoside hydrolase domain-containing protein [Candidatus Hydrogenedentota bacterium]